ncbi:NfeD family protein [Allofournierella massiliensis]|uniref:NfeD family protein n=1 Tax=Allofournierella massiliensis TaxID=1650663 RepID=A0ABT7USL1_9FIRM|nr:NfeD family protein [Fournierella massiliensis]MDM8201862.1 NfeD family protein [Fournierella massiliensis]
MEILLSTTAAIWLWAVLLAVFVVVELATANLVTVWFAVGALAALIASLFTHNLLWQALVFLLVSLVALIATKPLVSRARSRKPAAAVELDRNIGRTAQALEDLRPGVVGRVRLDGVDWNAVTDSPIRAGERCTVQSIGGTTLTVAPEKTPAAAQ